MKGFKLPWVYIRYPGQYCEESPRAGSRHSILILSQNHFPVFFETMETMYDVHNEYNEQPIGRVLSLDKKTCLHTYIHDFTWQLF